jgi:hypothetical protein
MKKRSKSLFGRLNNEVGRNSADKAAAFHRSSLREKALPKNACRPNPSALSAQSASKNSVNPCSSVKSVVKNQLASAKPFGEDGSIKNNKLCETNPISEKPKMNLTNYMTNRYDNKSPPSTMEKQSQFKAKTNPNKANLDGPSHAVHPKQSQIKPKQSQPVVSEVEPFMVILSNQLRNQTQN